MCNAQSQFLLIINLNFIAKIELLPYTFIDVLAIEHICLIIIFLCNIFLANKESLNIKMFAYIPSLIMGNFLVLI